MRKAFIDKDKQVKFQNTGVLVIENFLNTSDLSFLTDLFQNFESKAGENFYVSNWVENQNKVKIHQAISDIFTKRSKSILKNYKTVYGGFAVKKNTTDNLSEMGIHQDWSFVNEKKYTPLSIWVPLCDVSLGNGCMSFFEGSHEIFKNIRGFNIKPQIDHVQDYIKARLSDYPVKAGDAIILNSRIVHYSHPNNSQSARVAAMLAMVPEEADVKYYARKTDNPFNFIDEYNCTDNFYLHQDINKLPDFEPTKSFYDLNNSESKEHILNAVSHKS